MNWFDALSPIHAQTEARSPGPPIPSRAPAHGRSVRRPFALVAAVLCVSASAGSVRSAEPAAPVGSFITIPETIVSPSGQSAEGERGLFFVRENRANPASRAIAVQFQRFRSLDADVASGRKLRPPVFLLAGGPGSEYDFRKASTFDKLQRMRKSRDVVYVSQRGNPRATGLVSPMWVKSPAAPLGEPGTAAVDRETQRATLRQALSEWSSRGVDLAGYDILNIVDDLYELRAALGYQKIALCGCSFGSQWSLSYIKRWPQTVERALLGGVEPLDYAYDSPKWLWASMVRVARDAEADQGLKPHIPPGGLIKALQTVITRLEKEPVKVGIVDPTNGKPVDVTIGADDLRAVIGQQLAFEGATKRDRLTHWPRFILELARGDYRDLAAKAWEARVNPSPEVLILPLIDNSLGITAARDARLVAEPEARWLGDINGFYHNTRDLTPTPNVGDAFRADWTIDAPVLMVQGDYDWSTPLENAEHERKFLRTGHLLTVKGGTHCTDNDELPALLPDTYDQVYGFLDVEMSDTSPPQKYFSTLPATVTYPPLAFEVPAGPSLYEQWLSRKSAK